MVASDQVLQEYEAVRRSGKTNMFDVEMVQKIAFECDYHSLVQFIEREDNDTYLEMAQLSADVGYQEMDDLPVEPVPETLSWTVTM